MILQIPDCILDSEVHYKLTLFAFIFPFQHDPGEKRQVRENLSQH